jgi:acetylornithine/succinyldiaminopimelate/putrescine aminotransferase
VLDVRGAGLLLAARLSSDEAKDVAARALEAGLLVNAVRPDSIRVAPPLLVSDAEIDEALAILGRALAGTGASGVVT